VVAGPMVPRRSRISGTAGWSEALEVLRKDGAVVLTGLTTNGSGGGPVPDFQTLASTLPARLFPGGAGGLGGQAAGEPPHLLSPRAPVNGVHDELREAQRRGLYLPGSGLEPHTDGYVYGDDLPDYVFLLCEQPSAQGGANVLLDGQALLAGLGTVSDEGGSQLAEWLQSTPVDLSEPGETGITTGRLAEGPVVQWHRTPSGRKRLKFRRQVNIQQAQRLRSWHPLKATSADQVSHLPCSNVSDVGYLSLWRPLTSADKLAAAAAESKLHELDLVIQRASVVAFAEHSFSLAAGEALVIDNYRMLHGRLPYLPASEEKVSETERRFWRVWSWTSEGSGLPPDGAGSSHPLNDKVFGARQAGDSRTDL